MVTQLKIENYKSIVNQTIPLSRMNVFIGENGSGKSNVLEAVGMLAAAKNNELKNDQLFTRGIRVAKSSLTYNSFVGHKSKNKIEISIIKDNQILIEAILKYDLNNSSWIDLENNRLIDAVSALALEQVDKDLKIEVNKEIFLNSFINIFHSKYFKNSPLSKKLFGSEILDYIIYNVNQNALRGLSNESKSEPLGLYGEGLDVLINNFNSQQKLELKKKSFINWLDEILVDESDDFKMQGFKLGRSTSQLYFTDKFMKRNNRLFSAENANEGALHILFYLALFISDKTPPFFAIDNIETALNPMMCRKIMLNLNELAITNNKQALITTHNPAILDGMNLNDPNQSLFVVKRDDDGKTVIDKIEHKPVIEEKKYKLSELWMRGYLGGVPNNF